MKILISQSAATSILFHATDLYKLQEILDSDKFKLTTGIGTEADGEHHKEYYYLSMTRSRLGDYHVRYGNTGSVLLTLDGNKLNQRYKTKPVDYWGEEYRKHKKGSYEAEDRLFTNDPFIDKASQYIVEIALIIKPDDINDKIKMWLRSVMLKAKLKHIPLYIFPNDRDWLTNNKAKAYKIAPKIKRESVFKHEEMPDYEQHRRRISRKDEEGYKNYRQNSLGRVFELYYKKSYDELSSRAQDYIKQLLRDWNKEKNTGLKNDIHNKRTGSLEGDRETVDNFVVILKKEKCDVDELLERLKVKWHKLLDN